ESAPASGLCEPDESSGSQHSERVFAPFTGADTNGFVDGGDEDLPVADAAGAGHGQDGLDDVTHDLVLDDDLDPDLGDEVDDIGGSAIDLFFPSGPTEALHLVDGHSLHADFPQPVLHVIELEWFDDGFDFFHEDWPTLSFHCF